MYRDYLGDIHKCSCDVERGIGDARRSRARDLMRPWKPQRGQHHQALRQTQTTNPKQWDAKLRTGRFASLDAWGVSHQFLQGPTQEADGDRRAKMEALDQGWWGR
jgi:hypothetical protein